MDSLSPFPNSISLEHNGFRVNAALDEGAHLVVVEVLYNDKPFMAFNIGVKHARARGLKMLNILGHVSKELGQDFAKWFALAVQKLYPPTERGTSPIERHHARRSNTSTPNADTKPAPAPVAKFVAAPVAKFVAAPVQKAEKKKKKRGGRS